MGGQRNLLAGRNDADPRQSRGGTVEHAACYPLFRMEAQSRISPTPEIAARPGRILMPSPLGALGIEILGTAVIRLTFEPAEPERSAFLPLHQGEGSDLLDETCGRLAEYCAGARRRLELQFDLSASGI